MTQSHRRFVGRDLARAGLLLALIVAAFAPGLGGEFIWDDDAHVTANPAVTGAAGWAEIWTTASANYFPLVLTAFRLQYAAWGANPFPYHVVTLLCHAVAALLLWRVLHRLRCPAPWIGAALWALHPIQVESVAWVSELKNTQSAVFFLLALRCFLRWLEPREHEHPQRDYWACMGFAAAAILSKSATVMLPVVMLAIAWWRVPDTWRRTLLALLPFFLLSAAASLWTIWEQRQHSGALGEEWNQSFPERLCLAGKAVTFYVTKLLWPDPLSFIYPRWSHSVGQLAEWCPLAVTLMAGGFVAWQSTRCRALACGVIGFAALLFPVLGFFDVYFFRYSFVSDHFAYLASMSWLALTGAALANIAHRATRLALSAAMIAAFGWLSAQHCGHFRTNEVLFRDILAKNPRAWMAHNNLAEILTHRDLPAALAHLHEAVRLYPRYPEANLNLAIVLYRLQREDESWLHVQRALTLNPKLPGAHAHLGLLALRRGETDRAIESLTFALTLMPTLADAHANLGVALQKRDPTRAVWHLHQALRLKPRSPEAHNNLANALRETGRNREAIEHYNASLALDPRQVSARYNLGNLLLETGDAAGALSAYDSVLELEPTFPEEALQLNRGTVLLQLGRPSEAVAAFRASLIRRPNNAAAHFNLANTLAVLGDVTGAADEYSQALAADPLLAEAQLNLGNLMLKLGRFPEAIECYNAALRIRPNYAAAAENLRQVKAHLESNAPRN